jgi:hypothetical protein
VQSIKHILKDSQQLLQLLEDYVFNQKMFLYSFDFESLYTNIESEHAVLIISIHLQRFTNIFQEFKISIIGFQRILSIIFSCNVFSYSDKSFLQLIGLPMGCVCGPSVANLYVYILEKEWLSIYNDVIYFRFIDDIFIAASKPIDLNLFKSFFFYLKLNVVHGESVVFLDLNIKFDVITGRFIFSLYIKPTHSFGFLLTKSNHPNFIFSNIPISVLIRIRRNCTKLVDFYFYARILLAHLFKRNYNYKAIMGIIRNLAKIDRKTLLPYKYKNNNFLKYNNFNVFMEFDINNQMFKNNLYHSYNVILKHHSIFNTKKLMIVNKIKNNIGSIMIHNFKFESVKKFSYKKCFNSNCIICKYSSNFHCFFLSIQIQLIFLKCSI